MSLEKQSPKNELLDLLIIMLSSLYCQQTVDF